MNKTDFFNFYNHGFIRVAACVPELRVADPAYNAEKTIELCRAAAKNNALMAVFPELGISAYSNEDLFHQDALLEGVLQSLEKVLAATRELNTMFAVGAPLRAGSFLFNCAVVFYRGNILGVAVKSYLPNYREYYEARHFKPASEALCRTISICGQQDIPFGADLLFEAENIPNLCFYFEICEDVWVPVPPSSYAAMAGATVIANLSASNITIAKAEYRRELVSNQSARCISAYLYTAAGPGESTTDLAWDGNAMIFENGLLLAEAERFKSPQVIYGEVDLDRLAQDRMRMNTWAENARDHKDILNSFRRVGLKIEIPRRRLPLTREIARFPYVPADPRKRDRRCYEAYNIQVQGLAKRLEASGTRNAVIGVSGGLDSTHALIVAARTMDLLGRPRSDVKAYTMPGFATTDKTYRNAIRLMKALKVEANEIDIRPSCMKMFEDIGHPFARGRKVYDITFENVQAGERTSHLFRIANLRNGLVVGTGDLSELALGWCTFGVGDQMSHYNVNASVPKTLIQYLIRWVAASDLFGPKASRILLDILDTEISPELVPGENGSLQATEAAIGPYELQDFNTFYTVRFGFPPAKIAFMSYCAWRDKSMGAWPDVPEDKRNQYTIGEIKRWLGVFVSRFFQSSQFKRSSIPNAPKIGSGGSLSPRSDYRAPSDSEAAVWLQDVKNIPGKD
jgi:NAD+ synthase (glutamine-hydrolysing)